MSKTISEKEFRETVTAIGEFRNRNVNYFIEIDNTLFTWSELGGDMRFAEWLYGKFMLYYDGEGSFYDYAISILDNKIMIRDWLQNNYTLPENCEERTWTYLADKCVKSIGFGAPWIQVQRFVEKQLEYLENHPRGPDGKRGRWEE